MGRNSLNYLQVYLLSCKRQPSQNGQTHSNNLSAAADELFECDHFVGLALGGLHVPVPPKLCTSVDII